MSTDSFSRRNQYAGEAKEVTVREDAPESLRVTVLETARELGWTPSALRSVVCRVLRVRPNPGNWGEYPNIWDEVQGHVYNCEWFKVYDLVEALYADTAKDALHWNNRSHDRFAEEINRCLFEQGIGWQVKDGLVVVRGSEAFESIVQSSPGTVEECGYPTAASHLHEALRDLSRRPSADLAGAIYHAMGALEAIARDLVDDPKATLGEIIKSRPDLLPPPLDKALSQIWGFASNQARHVVEGDSPIQEDTELVVGLAATLALYLSKKKPGVK